MGVNTVVVGLRPAVVIALVDMGMRLPGVATALNVARALDILNAKRQDDDERSAPLPPEDWEDGHAPESLP
jgi:hypothetical protein